MKHIANIFCLLLWFNSCSVTKEESFFKNQITFTEKKSWWKVSIYEEEREKTPKRLIQTTTVWIDTTKQVKYTTIEKLKKDKSGYYFHVDNKEKTIKISKSKSKFIASSYHLSGIFKPNYLIQGDKFKMEFKLDGTCIYKWKTQCSDSPCYSDRMSKGIYKIFNDSVYVQFYQGKTQTYYIKQDKKTPVSIEKIKWGVINSYNMTFIFNKTHDTLKLINERGNKIRSNYVFTPTGSTKIIYEKTKDATILKEEKLRIEKEYQEYIKRGDKAFNEKDYTLAYTFYTGAVKLNPADSYSKQKMAEIKKLEQDESDRIEQAYILVIKKADEYFDKKQYDQAKRYYTNALNIKPFAQYPADKLQQIKLILGE